MQVSLGGGAITKGLHRNLQHVNVKIFAAQSDFDPAVLAPVFHRWIRDQVAPEMTIDVADYKHVPDGPGIMLIGHEADYSFDNIGGRPGLLYNRKFEVSGDALRQAYDAAISAAKRLELEPELAGKLRFDYGEIEIILNDRLLFPNTEATWDRAAPQIERFFAGVYGEGKFTMERRGEVRDRFMVDIKRR